MELSDLIVNHSEDLEADLARWYPRDSDQLAEYHAGRMSLRRLWVLVSRLPNDSRTMAIKMGGDEVAAWTLSVELAAQAVDVANRHAWMFATANRGRHDPIPEEPKPVPRPKGYPRG